MDNIKYAHITLNYSDLYGAKVSKKISYIVEGYYLFFNCQHLLIQVPSEARAFFDFVCEKMRSDDNSIRIDKSLKENFIEHISKITSKKVTPAISSLNKYVSDFKRLGLILPLSKREFYNVNPKYVYKGYKKNRLKLLKSLIEEKISSGKSPIHLVDKPAQFFSTK